MGRSAGRYRLSSGPIRASRQSGREWTVFSVGDGLGHVDVYTITAGTDGSVWFGTPAGVSQRLPS